MTGRRPRLYSAEEDSKAVAAAAKEPDRFLTAEDVDEIADEVGVPAEVVHRELDGAPIRAGTIRVGIQIRSAGSQLQLSSTAPGFRPSIIAQLFGTFGAGGVLLYWLAGHIYWTVAAALVWLVWAARTASIARRETTIIVERDSISAEIDDWFGGRVVEIPAHPLPEISVEDAGEDAQIKFFPMYFLSIRSEFDRVELLHGHDPISLNAARKAMLSWLHEHSSTKQTRPR